MSTAAGPDSTIAARETLLRALGRIDEALANGAAVDALVVVIGATWAGGDDTRDGVAWETSDVPSWSASGLLRAAAARIEAG